MNRHRSNPTSAPEQRFSIGNGADIPENLQTLARESVAKTRDAYAKMTTVVHELSEVAQASQTNAKMLNEKLMQNMMANTAAAFDAADAMASAKTLAEYNKLQSAFLQQQTAETVEQTKEFFDLAMRSSQHLFERLQASTRTSLEQMKPAI